MGWTTCYVATEWKYVGGRRVVDRQKECDRLLNQNLYDSHGSYDRKDWTVIGSMKVLKSAMVGSTYYAAVETKTNGTSPYVSAAVFLTCGKGSDGTVWGYKDMDENMGPCEDKCPASILALLSPTDSKNALEWRERCRENIRMKAEERKNGPKPMYAPSGVKIWVEGRSWLITSDYYSKTTYYRACKFSKARWQKPEYAVRAFLDKYGTVGQRAEWMASGREYPKLWKEVAA